MTDDQRPPLVLVRGEASDEEVAALTVVLQAMAAVGATARQGEHRPKPEWSAHHRRLRRPLVVGPGAWRSSALPH